MRECWIEGWGNQTKWEGALQSRQSEGMRGKAEKEATETGGEEVGKLTISLSETPLNFLRWWSAAA